MARRFHLPALGGLFATLGGLATAVAQVPALTNSTIGKLAALAVAIGSVVQSVTKPVKKE